MDSEFDIIDTPPRAGMETSETRRWALRYIVGNGKHVKHRGRVYVHRGDRYTEETELTDKVRKFLMQHGGKHTNERVSNVVADIHAIGIVDSYAYPAMPFYDGPDAFPDADSIIAFANGLLDVNRHIDQGQCDLVPHTDKWVSTFCLPYAFNPSADCPQWLAFLEQVFGDDRTLLLQEWFGYCLLSDTSQHKFLVKYGPPRAGKGTIDYVLQELLGASNCAAYSLHNLAERFGLGALLGKHVAFVGEVNLTSSPNKHLILEKLNSIVGGDTVSVEIKHAPIPHSVRLPTRFNLSCNELPSFIDPSGALAARLMVLPFDRSFVGEEDRTLKNRLADEVSGICNWAIEGLRRLRHQGAFTVPARSQGLVTEFRRSNSQAFAFVQDCLQVETEVSPGNLPGVRLADGPLWISRKQLAHRHSQWCVEQGQTYSGVWLGRDLRTLLPKMQDEKRGGERGHRGIGLLPLEQA